VGCGFLNVAQRHSGVEGGGDEGVAQGVRPDGLGDPGAAGDTADDPAGAVPVQSVADSSEEDRARPTVTAPLIRASSGCDNPRR
jgi:hypothetical protein